MHARSLLAAPAVRLLLLSFTVPFATEARGSAQEASTVRRFDEDQELVPSGNLIPLLGDGLFSDVLTGAGAWCVYAAEVPADAEVQFYGAPLDGSSAPVQLTAKPAGSSFGDFAISPSGDRFVYSEFVVGVGWDLFSVPVQGGPVTRLAGPLPLAPQPFTITPDSLQVIVRANVLAPSRYELFRIPIDGGTLTRINDPGLAVGDVGTEWTVRADSSLVLFTSDLETDFLWELYVAPLDGSTAPQKLSGPAIAGTHVFDVSITPDGQTVLYTASHQAPSGRELFAVPIDGSASPIEIGATAPLRRVLSFLATADSSTVLFRADRASLNNFDLWRVPVDGSQLPVEIDPAPLGGRIAEYALSPDDSTVAFVTTDGRLGSMPLFGTSAVPLDDPASSSHEGVEEFVITPDSTRVVYRGDDLVPDRTELFSVPLDGSGLPVRVHRVPDGLGSVTEDWALTDDGQHVLYRGDLQQERQFEVFRSSVLGFGIDDVVVHPPLPNPSRSVFRAQRSVDGSFVTFLADYAANGVPELYSKPLEPLQLARKISQQLPLVSSTSTASGFEAGDGRLLSSLFSPHWGHRLFVRDVGLATAPRLLTRMEDEEAQLSGALRVTRDRSRAFYTWREFAGATCCDLFSVPLDGSTDPVRVTTDLRTSSEDLHYDVSPLSDQVVYVEDGGRRLFAAPLDASASPRLLFTSAAPGQPLRPGPRITEDGLRAVFRVEVSGQELLYVVPIDGSGPETLLSTTVPAGETVEWFTLAPSGAGVFYAQTRAAGGSDLLVVAEDGSGVPQPLTDTGSFVFDTAPDSFELLPDGSGVLFRSLEDGKIELVLQSFASGASRVVLSEPGIGSVDTFASSLAAGAAFFVAEASGSGDVLVRAELDGSSPPVILTAVDANAGAPEVTPDGAWVLYLAGGGLFGVPSDGSGPAVRLNGPPTSSFARGFGIDPASEAVLYYQTDASFQGGLFAAPLDGSVPAVAFHWDRAAGESVRDDSYAISSDGRFVTFHRTAQGEHRGLFLSEWKPSASAVTPVRGSSLGGTVVTVTGSGFDPSTTVTFDGVPATTHTWVSANELRVVAPPSAGGAVPPRGTRAPKRAQVPAPERTVDVVVHRAFFRSELVQAYTYEAP